MAVSPQRLTIYLYSTYRVVIFAIAQLSCLVYAWMAYGCWSQQTVHGNIRCLLNPLQYIDKHVYVGMFHIEFSVLITMISLGAIVGARTRHEVLLQSDKSGGRAHSEGGN